MLQGNDRPDSHKDDRVHCSRLGMFRNTTESKALRRATLADIATDGDMNEADLSALGQDSLGLLDAFVDHRLTGRYSEEMLATVEGTVRGIPSGTA